MAIDQADQADQEEASEINPPKCPECGVEVEDLTCKTTSYDIYNLEDQDYTEIDETRETEYFCIECKHKYTDEEFNWLHNQVEVKST